MKTQQKSFKTIDSCLKSIIKESLRSTLQRRALQEKEIQDAMSDEDKSEANSDEKQKLKKGDVLPSDIVDKLNSIRSGKSFKDSAVSKSLEDYVNDMTKAEKTALFAFLKGISQIVTGEISADVAIDPSDKPAGIEMEKTAGSKKVTLKPVVIKKAGENKKEKSKSKEEDTSGPVPITPKKK